MATHVPAHDEELMPITLGHPLRCPSDDWHKYGMKWDTEAEFLYLLGRGRDCYRDEWEKGDEGQIDVVKKASERAFEGKDNNQLLRDVTGKVVATYLSMQTPAHYFVVEMGAGTGLSFETFYRSLPDDFKGSIHALLLDPSVNSLKAAEEKMKDFGVTYELAVDTQDNLPKHMEGRKANVIFQVGSIHHDPRIPFDKFSECAAATALFASGDWHPQTWQEPYYVYKMLETFDWPKKEEGLAHYKKTYGVKETPFPQDPKDAKAIQDIYRFWQEYFKGLLEYGDPGKNSIWPHESHQDHRRYITSLENVGFSVNDPYLNDVMQEAGVGNPHFFYPDSSIIVNVAGIKDPQI